MKKLVSYMLVFVIGFGACALILNCMGCLSYPSPKKASLKQALVKPSGRTDTLGPNPIADAVARVGPAVVNIDTVSQRTVTNPFAEMFRIPFPLEREIVAGQGSGVIITSDGYVLTNNHVVAGAQNIQVRLADGRKMKARLVSRNSRADLAVLKINAKNLPYAILGDSDAIRVGDWAIAIGNPLGLGNTVTVGVISAKKRTNLPVGNGKVIEEAIQTDAAINRGNSGGALANIKGEVIGINTAILSTEPGQGNIGLGFAIPSNYARGIIKQLIEEGSVRYAYLGVVVADLSGDLAAWYEQQGYKGKGAVIGQVQEDGPASKAGLMQGDIITKIDNCNIRSAEDVTKYIRRCKVGQVVRLAIWRDGRMLLLGVKLGELPPDLE